MIEETFFDRYYVTVHDTGKPGACRFCFNVDDQDNGDSYWGYGPSEGAAMGSARARVETMAGRTIEQDPDDMLAQKLAANPAPRRPLAGAQGGESEPATRPKRRPPRPLTAAEPPDGWDLDWKQGEDVKVRTRDAVQKLPTYFALVDLPIYGPGRIVLLPEWHGNYSATFKASRPQLEGQSPEDAAEAPYNLTLWDHWRRRYSLDRVKDEAERWARSVGDDAKRRPQAPKRPTTVKWFRAGSLRTLGGRGLPIWRSHDLQVPGSGLGYLEVAPRMDRKEQEYLARWFSCDPEGTYHQDLKASYRAPESAREAKKRAKAWAQQMIAREKERREKERAAARVAPKAPNARPRARRNPRETLKRNLLL